MAGKLTGIFWIGGSREHGVDSADLVGGGAHVDGRWMPVETEVGLRGREADQHRRVDLGCEHGGSENADNVEPLAADDDAFARQDLVDAEPGPSAFPDWCLAWGQHRSAVQGLRCSTQTLGST